MFIHATTIQHHYITVQNLEEFRRQCPDAEIQSIDGTRADSVCEKGHLFQSTDHEYHSPKTRCQICWESAPCPDGCGQTNGKCDCIPF